MYFQLNSLNNDSAFSWNHEGKYKFSFYNFNEIKMINKIQISQQIKYSDFSTHVILPFLRGIWYSIYEHCKLYTYITIVGNGLFDG